MERALLNAEDVAAMAHELRGRDGWGAGLYLCKSGPLSGQFATDTIFSPSIDEAAMTVRMRISTAQLDRVNHIVKQKGIRTDYYVDNPVVLFGHGMEGIVLPVAQSEDEFGNLTVSTEDDGTYAKAYHHKGSKLSSQFFDLVVQKFLRASSIGITPISISKGRDCDGDEILVIEEGYLNEWSYCTMAINPGCIITKKSIGFYRENVDLQSEAANRILVSNKLDGTSIHPVIKKSLQASLVVPVTSPGIKFEETPIMKTLTIEQVKKMKTKALVKALSEINEYQPEVQQLIKNAVDGMPDDEVDASEPAAGPAPAVEEAPEPEVVEVVEVEVEAEEDILGDASEDDAPLGAKVLRAMYDNLHSLIGQSEKAVNPVEAPEVKAAASELIEQLRDLSTSLEGVYATKYPNQSMLSPPVEEPTEEYMKSFFAHNARGKDQLSGLSARVEMVSKSVGKTGGKLSVQQAKLLSQTAKDLARLNTLAKAFKPTPVAVPVAPVTDKSEVEAIQVAFAEVTKQFKSLVETLSVTPAPIPAS